ncbi:MAG: cytochrome c oxidase subunit, partial [Baekduia sp.]|nr:cytochrome c oxidase subunit [Baekduia sp.]
MTVRVRQPGWTRAAAFMLVGFAFSVGISWLVRMLYGHGTFRHYLEAESFVLISMFVLPFAFLIGLGAFDYWFYWAAGRPTRPEDHSGHGATSWKSYFY